MSLGGVLGVNVTKLISVPRGISLDRRSVQSESTLTGEHSDLRRPAIKQS
jgi:hypothetical protein